MRSLLVSKSPFLSEKIESKQKPASTTSAATARRVIVSVPAVSHLFVAGTVSEVSKLASLLYCRTQLWGKRSQVDAPYILVKRVIFHCTVRAVRILAVVVCPTLCFSGAAFSSGPFFLGQRLHRRLKTGEGYECFKAVDIGLRASEKRFAQYVRGVKHVPPLFL